MRLTRVLVEIHISYSTLSVLYFQLMIGSIFHRFVLLDNVRHSVIVEVYIVY